MGALDVVGRLNVGLQSATSHQGGKGGPVSSP